MGLFPGGGQECFRIVSTTPPCQETGADSGPDLGGGNVSSIPFTKKHWISLRMAGSGPSGTRQRRSLVPCQGYAEAYGEWNFLRRSGGIPFFRDCLHIWRAPVAIMRGLLFITLCNGNETAGIDAVSRAGMKGYCTCHPAKFRAYDHVNGHAEA